MYDAYEHYRRLCEADGDLPVPLDMFLALTKPEKTVTNEQDPSGINQHQPGAKLDAGKLRPRLIFDSMARALDGVVRVGTFGANKYTDGGWLEVAGGIERYRDAQLRHESKRALGELIDPDSKLPHDFHIAWNILAQVELKARRGDYKEDASDQK